MKIRLYCPSRGISMLFLALGAATLAGCGGGTSSSGAPVVTPPVVTPPVVALPVQPQPVSPTQLSVVARSLRTPLRVGTPVELELEVKNVADRPVILQFTSGQSFNFTATRVGETEPAYNYAMDKIFTAALRSQTLGVGETVKFNATWDNPMPGRYNIVGTLTTNPPIDAAPFTIEIAP